MSVFKSFGILICLLAFQALPASELAAKKYQEAEELFSATLYDKAQPLFQNLLNDPAVSDKESVRLRLAQIFYSQKKISRSN